MNRLIIAATCALSLAIAGMATVSAAGLAQSASKVDVNAEYTKQSTDMETQLVRVKLNIADGWHVNAHPASLDFLVPTAIQAKAGGKTLALDIDWPEGHNSGIVLGGTAIKVYSDNTVIPVRLSPAATQAVHSVGQLSLNIRVQACSDDGLCLPPSTLDVRLTRQ